MQGELERLPARILTVGSMATSRAYHRESLDKAIAWAASEREGFMRA
jgi:hypothetical protein